MRTKDLETTAINQGIFNLAMIAVEVAVSIAVIVLLRGQV